LKKDIEKLKEGRREMSEALVESPSKDLATLKEEKMKELLALISSLDEKRSPNKNESVGANDSSNKNESVGANDSSSEEVSSTSKSLTDIFAPTVNKMKEYMAHFDKKLSEIRYSLEEEIEETKEKIEDIELRIEEINRRLAEKLDDSNLNHEVALLQKNLLESYLTSLRGDVGLLEDCANRASQEVRDVFIQAANNTIDHIVSPVEETSKDDFFNSEMNMAQSVFESRYCSIELRKEEILAKRKHSNQQVAKAEKIIGIINNIKNPMINIENQVNAAHKALVEDNSRTIKQLDDVMNKLSGANLPISRENIKKLIEEKINTYNEGYIRCINKIKEDYISSIASDIDMEKKNNQSLIDAAKKGIIYSNNTDTIDIRDGNITEAIRQINTHNEAIKFEDLAKSANVAILKMNNSKIHDSEEIIYVITAVSSVLKALEVKKEEIEVKKRGYIRDMKACMMRDIEKNSDRKASLGERIDSLLGGMKDSMIADAIDPVAQALIAEANKAATEEIDNIINQGLGDLYLEYTDDLPQVSSDVFGKGSAHFEELANKSIRRISDIDISSLNSGIIGSDKDIRKLDKAGDRVLVEGYTKLIEAVASLENTSDLAAAANEKYSKIVEEKIRTAERLLVVSKDIIDEKIQETVEKSLKDSLRITRSILEEETMKVINDYLNDFTQRSNKFEKLLNANEFLITCLESNLTRTNGGYLLPAEQIAKNITEEVVDFKNLYFADNKLIDYFEGFSSGEVESECIDKIESQSIVIQEVIIEADKACQKITLEMKKYIDDFFSGLVDKVTEGKEKDVFKLITYKASMLLSDKICKPIYTALRGKSSFTDITLDKEAEKKRVEEIYTNFHEKYSSILELLTNTKIQTLCDTITQATKSIESEKEEALERLKSMTDDFNTRGITIDAELIGGVKGILIKYYEDKMTIINNEISDSISEEIVTPAAGPDTLIGNTVDALKKLKDKHFSERAIKERNEEITEFLKKEVNKSAIKGLETLQEKKLLAEINVALKLLGISEKTDLYNAIASLYADKKRDHVSKGLRSEIATKLLTDEHLISFLILSDAALIMDIFKYLPFELKGSIAKTLLTMGDEKRFSLDAISELLLYLSQKDEEEFKEANENLVRSLQASDLWPYKIGDLKGYKEADKLFADIISNTEESKLPEIVIDTLNKLKNDADKKPNSIRESLLNDQGANVIQKVCEKLVVSIISSSTSENQKLYFNLLKEITKELPPKTAKNILNSRKMNKIAKENYKKDLLKAIQDWISIEKMGELDKFKKIEDIAASLKIFIDLDLGEPVDYRLDYISNRLNDICVRLKLPDFNDFKSMEGFNREKYIDKANELINSDILDLLAECRKCYANYAMSKTSFNPEVSNAVQQWLEELTGAIKDLQTPSKKEKDKVKSKADINNELFKEWGGAILDIDDSMEVYRTKVGNSDQDNFKIVALALSPERFKDSEMLLNMLHNGSKSTTVAVAPVPHAVATVPQRRATKTMTSDIKLQNKLGKPTMTQKLRRELYGKFAEKALGNEDLLSKFKPEDRCTYIMNFFRWIPEISKPRFAKDILIKYGFEKFSDEDKLKLISCLDRKYVEEKKLNPQNKMVEEAQILISDLCDPGSKTIEASIDSLKKKKSELIYAAALQCKDQENVQEVLKQLISYITLSRDENNKQEGFKILKSFVKGLPSDAVVDALNHKSITELDGDKKLLNDIVKWATIEKDENKFTETAEKIFSIIERLNAIIVPQDEYHKVDDSLKNIHCLLENLKDDIGNRFTLDKFEDIEDLRNKEYNKLLFASLDEKVLREIKKCKEAYDYTVLSGSNTYEAFIRDDAKSLFEELIGAVEYVRRKAREEEGVEKEFDQMQGELKLEMISIMNHIKNKSAYAPQHREYHIDAHSGMDFASLISKLFDGKGLNDAINKYYNFKSDKDKKIFNELCLSRQLLEKFALKMLKNKAFVHEALNKRIMDSDNIMRMFGFIPYDLKRSIAGGLLELKSVEFSSELLTELMRSVDIEEEKRFRQKNKIRVIRAERDIYKKSHKDLGKMIKCSFDDGRSMAELFDLLAYGDDEHSAISINALESFSPDELRSFISVNLREEKDAKIMKAAFKRLFVYMLDPSLSESDDIMKCDRVLEEMVRVLPRHTVLEVINDKRIDEAIKNYGRDGLEADIKVCIADISNWIIRFLASIVVGFGKPKFVVGDELYKEKKALDSRRDSSLQRLKNMRTIMPIRKESFDTFYQMNDLLIELDGLIGPRTASDSPTVKAYTDILRMRSLFDVPLLFDPEWFAKNIADDKCRASELEKYKLLSDAIRDGTIMDRIQSCKDIYRKIGSRNGEGNDCNTFRDNRIKNCLAKLLDIGENAQSKLQKEEMTKFKLKAKDEDQLLSDAKEIFDRLRSPMKSLTDDEEGVMNDLSSKYEESVRNISNTKGILKGILKNEYHAAHSARATISSLDSIINSRLKGKSSYKKELDEYFERKLELLKSKGNSFKTRDEYLARRSKDSSLSKNDKEEIKKEILLLDLDKAEEKENDLLSRLVPLKLKIEANLEIKGITDLRRYFSGATNHLLNQRLKQLREKDRPTASDCKEINLIELRKELLGELAADVLTNKDLISLIAPDRNDLTTVTDMIPFISGSRIKSVADFLIKRYGHIQELYLLGPYLDNKDLQKFTKVAEAFARTQGKKDIKFEELKKYANNPANFAEFTRFYDDEAICKVIASKLNSAEGAKSIEVFIRYMYSRSPTDIMYAGWDQAKESDSRDYQEKMATLFKRFSSVLELFPEKTCLAALKSIEMSQKNGDAAWKTERLTDDQKSSISEWIKAKKRGLDERSKKISAIIKELNMRISLRSDYDRDIEIHLQ